MKDVLKRAKAILANATATSTEEEFAYFIAKLEIDEGTYSEGLMSKAFSKAQQHGDVKHAVYIELRAAQLLGDAHEYLKQLQLEWSEQLHQEKLREQELVEGNLKKEYESLRLSLGEKYNIDELHKKEKEELTAISPYKELEEKSEQSATWLAIYFVIGGIAALLSSVELRLEKPTYIFGTIFAVSLVLFAYNCWQGIRIRKSMNLDNYNSIQNALKETQSEIAEYKLELSKHPAHSLVNAEKPENP